MGLPELLVLIGFLLLALGAIISLVAFLLAASRSGLSAAGLILIGPIPIVVLGKEGRFLWLTLALAAALMVVLFLLLALGVVWPWTRSP